MTATPSPVWFITGCSTGFGRALAQHVIAQGAHAVVTARNKASVEELAGAAPDRTLALALDVTAPDQIAAAVQAAKEKFGRIDVLVNNAGYGYQATVEEGEDAEIRGLFEANVFGLFAVTRAVLPLMREQRSGHVISITSVGGLTGRAGSGYYSASKHAIEGWSDALAAEGKPLGIRVTCVEPGAFRTDWAGRSLRQTAINIADYEQTAGANRDALAQRNGRQHGDPARAAEVIMHIAQADQPPRHIVLGSEGLETVLNKLQWRLETIEAWAEIGRNTDFTD